MQITHENEKNEIQKFNHKFSFLNEYLGTLQKKYQLFSQDF